MKYSIQQVNDTTWELRSADGKAVATFTDQEGGRTGYDQALLHLGTLIADEQTKLAQAGNADEGLLPEGWVSDEGIAFSEKLAGGRDFTNCEWSWRDPATSLSPLMLQTETDWSHMGAELAGFATEYTLANGTVSARGRFYDNDAGNEFRQLLGGGRRFGVSVDPSEKVDVDESFTCTEQDEDGFCIAGEWKMDFLSYEIAGLTGTPFPGFERASIILDGEASSSGDQAAAAVRASGKLSIPVKPPRDWMTLPEPQIGEKFLDGMGEDVLVEQVDRNGNVVAVACPLTIRDDGLVFAHLTYWGQCHTGNPWGPGLCASATPSSNGYADFLTNQVQCEDGTTVRCGPLVVGCEHSDAFDVAGVRDHLAHAGLQWASVNVVDGEHGPWMCGVLSPNLTEQQVALLRRLALSGEWVGELGGILAVNSSGLPVQRQLAASALGEGRQIPAGAVRASRRGGAVTKVVGANLVQGCRECAQRRAADGATRAQRAELAAGLRSFDEALALLRMIERRTQHLIPAAAEHARASLSV